MKNPLRRRWTLAIRGRWSDSHTSLDEIYKFRRARDAMQKATEFNNALPKDYDIGFVAEER